MAEHFDSNHSLYPKTGRSLNFKVEEGVEDGAKWKETRGLVSTVYGYVDCFAASFEGEYNVTQLSIIKDGREYTRDFEKEYTVRGMVTKAKAFAKDVFEGADDVLL